MNRMIALRSYLSYADSDCASTFSHNLAIAVGIPNAIRRLAFNRQVSFGLLRNFGLFYAETSLGCLFGHLFALQEFRCFVHIQLLMYLHHLGGLLRYIGNKHNYTMFNLI
jgi:hypothetical protein